MTSIEKLTEEIGSLSALDLAALVKAIEEKFGVSAAVPVSMSAPTAGGPVVEAAAAQTEFKVTLKEAADKIKVIKALRKVVPTLSLSDAKKAVEEAPTVIAEAASKTDAATMKKELEEAGAKVELS